MFFVPAPRRAARFAHPLAAWFDERLLDTLPDPAPDRRDAAASGAASAQRSPALELRDDDAGYTVQLDMPGVGKDAIQVAIDGRDVTVQTGAPSPAPADAAAAPPQRVVYSERRQASYARSFRLPTEIDQAGSSARLENGVLTLTLAKKVAPRAAQLTVN